MISLKKESESRKIPHRSQIGSQIGSVCHSCLGAGPYLCRRGVGAGGGGQGYFRLASRGGGGGLNLFLYKEV